MIIQRTEQEWRLYRAYLESNAWGRKRDSLIRLTGYKCEICGSDTPPLHCHHLDYARFKNEELTDLVLLCIGCHQVADHHRKNTYYQEEFAWWGMARRWRTKLTFKEAYKQFLLEHGYKWRKTIFGIRV